MKKIIIIIHKVYTWLKTLPAYYLIPILLFVQFAVTFLLQITGLIDGGDQGDAPSSDEMPLGELIVLACVFAPLFETLVGQLLPIEILLRISKKLKAVAVVFSAVLFGLQHQYSFSYMIFGLVTGFVYALGYLVSRERGEKKYAYWVIVASHAIWNTSSVIMTDIL